MSISPFAVPNKQKMNFLLLALALLSVSSTVSSSPKQGKSKTISIDCNLLQIIDFHSVAQVDSNILGFLIQWIARTDEFQTMSRNAMQST